MNCAGFHGLILAGAGGVGKSRFVRGVLHDALGKDFNNVVSWQEHHKIKVAELISTLEDHAASEKLIVFDDMDRMFDDCEMVEILSAALQNERQRTIKCAYLSISGLRHEHERSLSLALPVLPPQRAVLIAEFQPIRV